MLLESRNASEGIAIELTPIIDMVFLLLIFFLVATTFQQAEREMQIALPETYSAEPISTALRELVINVDAEGRMIVGGRLIQPEELRSLVAEAVETNPGQKVIVRGDHRTEYANVVTALDICKSSGIQEPYLDTVMAD
jgi:biopolymer transport protein ExbD